MSLRCGLRVEPGRVQFLVRRDNNLALIHRRRRLAEEGGSVIANAVGKRTSSNLADQVRALANGKTQQEIAAACRGARPHHVGAAIARFRRAGRIEEREGKLYAT